MSQGFLSQRTDSSGCPVGISNPGPELHQLQAVLNPLAAVPKVLQLQAVAVLKVPGLQQSRPRAPSAASSTKYSRPGTRILQEQLRLEANSYSLKTGRARFFFPSLFSSVTRGDLELGSDSDLVKDSRVREELVYI